MKRLIYFLLMFIPAVVFSQELKMPQIMLRTVDGGSVNASLLVDGQQDVLLYFFNNTTPEVMDNLQNLQELAENNSLGGQLKVIPVFNPENCSCGSLKAVLNGSDISLEAYIDVNGDLQRSLGLPMNSSILVSNFKLNESRIVTGTDACSYELALLDASYGGYNSGYPDRSNDWARNSSSNK